MAAKAFTKKRETEYNQICETYRQGVRTLFDTFKFFILFQAGLGTLAGAIFSRPEYLIKMTLPWFGHPLSVALPLFGVSLIGCSTALLAPFIAARLYRYHDTLVKRATAIEEEFDMHLITELGGVWNEGRSYRGATTQSLAVFVMIAGLWLIGIVVSFSRLP